MNKRISPILSEDSYRRFVAFMFAAAMVGWAGTWMRLVTEFTTTDSIPAITASEWHHIAMGFLYGTALVCFLWVYIERMAHAYLPRGPIVLALDFFGLAFLIIAATAWRLQGVFDSLALGNLLLFSIRFSGCARDEYHEWKKGRLRPLHMLMTQLVGLSMVVFLILIGAVLFSLTGRVTQDAAASFGYWALTISIIPGIALVAMHMRFYVPPTPTSASLHGGVSSPKPMKLVPAYWTVDAPLASRVMKAVSQGEAEFLCMIREFQERGLPVRHHISRVHAYRDVETQAFLLALAAPRNDVAMKWSAFWVYTSHWMDDVLDGSYASRIANEILRSSGNFRLRTTLDELDHTTLEFWREALKRTRDELPSWDVRMATLGVRRLMISAVMFSPRTSDIHDEANAAHKDLIMRTLAPTGPSSIGEFISKMRRRHLAYTSKVAFEIWEAFWPKPNLRLSLLLSILFAPGLLYHDYEEEVDTGEVLKEDEDLLAYANEVLPATVDFIAAHAGDRLNDIAALARSYVAVFEPILKDLHIYPQYVEQIDRLEAATRRS